ncbi:CHAT domain-containing protein [Scytonema sp. UIC 10036]|uniref:CHAT domain-containing protein n=1 Tax=Scytonema sp. UIC 10036 TaxID=2304196 RepID=UPI0012DA425A|nr:CHAT domain-containing tetratricopeptide repeat protein [Scytonema sp. UIC 10036]MUG91340.1 CHAT domain-containing protein [Scytonema sp. UIC 10036]
MKPFKISSIRLRRAAHLLINLLVIFLVLFAEGLPAPLGTALARAQIQDNRKLQADQLFQQGIKQYQSKQLEAAIESWEQALTIYRTLRDIQGKGSTLEKLAAVHLAQQNYSKAVEYLQPLLTIAQTIGNRKAEAQTLGNLGIAHRGLGKYAKAVELNLQALEIMRIIKDHQAEGQILGILGNAYASLGKYDQAIESHQQSLLIAQKTNDRIGEGTTLGNLGGIYSSLGDYNKAIESYKQSLEIVRSLNNREGEGYILNNLGVAYHIEDNLTQATNYYNQSLAIARTISNRQLEGEALTSLAMAYEDRGNFTGAIELHQQSLAIARAISNPQAEALALNNLGHTLFVSSNLVEAEKQLRLAIEVLKSLRFGLTDNYNVSVFDTQISTYNLLQQVLIAQNKPEAALEISEQGRARAFVALLDKGLSENLKKQRKNGINSVHTESITIAKIKQLAQAQKATFVEYSIVPDDSFKFQGKLRGRESKLFIWVVKPTGEVVFRQVDLKPLWQQKTSIAQLVTNSRESIGVRGLFSVEVLTAPTTDQKQRQQQLYNLLIKPIASDLPKNPLERVIFIPQESLFLVPFAALQDATGQYLVEKHTILTSPAIELLDFTQLQQQRLQGKAQDVLIVGNPTMPKVALDPGKPLQQLPPLPNAENEAIAIANLLNTQAIVGDKATKADILRQMPKARLIHLATHGLLNDVQSSGVPGAIALAPSSQDNGLLSASEIANLKLNAFLVVLSACDTGRGEITGDGVIGLSRSFISAGVPSIIVSLWAVPDSPTALLMTEFYRQLQHNPDKAQALRIAMLKTKEKHPNPKDWAAFTLIGEAD